MVKINLQFLGIKICCAVNQWILMRHSVFSEITISVHIGDIFFWANNPLSGTSIQNMLIKLIKIHKFLSKIFSI